jgi:hypothetical protein
MTRQGLMSSHLLAALELSLYKTGLVAASSANVPGLKQARAYATTKFGEGVVTLVDGNKLTIEIDGQHQARGGELRRRGLNGHKWRCVP